jgi:hypothetical protein
MNGLFRLIRSRPSQSSDESGVIGRIVPNHSAFRKRNPLEPEKRPLRLFEIARVRLDHVARFIINADHSITLLLLCEAQKTQNPPREALLD